MKKLFIVCTILIPGVVNAMFYEDDLPPLHRAALHGQVELINELVASGTNVDQEDYAKRTALALATHYQKESAVQTLIKLGTDVNHQDQNGYTALHYAGNISTALMLLAAGAAINKKTAIGNTPADVVLSKDVGSLLKRVADAPIIANQKLIAFMCAAHPRLGASSPARVILGDPQRLVINAIAKYVRQATIAEAPYQNNQAVAQPKMHRRENQRCVIA